jgi:CheY-like chemotaxis protein
MTGIELCNEVRSAEVVRSIPLVMVIAVSKAEDLIMAKKTGANNYISNLNNALTLNENLTVAIDDF